MTTSDGTGTGATDELVLQFLPSARTVGQARRAIGQFCRAGNHQSLADDAELLTSELMTNACRFGNGLITVLALSNSASVVVTVTDDHTGNDELLPMQQVPERDSGRGLFLVDTIASVWGTTPHTSGKSVWFSAAMMSPVEQMRLEEEVAGFQGRIDTLMLRLEHTLIALALTYDAQAAMQQGFNGPTGDHDRRNDRVRELQTAAERFRRLARNLSGAPPVP